MNNKGEANQMSWIIGALIVVVIAVALFAQIGSNSAELTTLNPATETVLIPRNNTVNVINESVTRTLTNAYAASDWRYTDTNCRLSNFVLKNASGTTLTVTTDYTINTQTGGVTFKNTAAVQGANTTNVTTATFNYCLPGYNSDSGSRGVAGIIPISAALVLLSGIVFFAYKALKEAV